MKILVTGFDPFGGETVNPALEAVKKLPDVVLSAEIIKLEIPTVFNQSAEVVEKAIQHHQPDIVLSIGQAGGRFGLTPERVAINVDDARIPDNIGNQPIDEKIQEDGEPAYFSTLPVKAITEKIKENGLPASVSNTAGTFVCNHIMYQVLYMVDKKFPSIKAGFIHVPYSTEQVTNKPNLPSMSVKNITGGLESALEAIVLYDKDIKVVGGETH